MVDKMFSQKKNKNCEECRTRQGKREGDSVMDEEMDEVRQKEKVNSLENPV